MGLYRAYGLTIHSDRPLLLPEEGFGAPEVTIREAGLDGWPVATPGAVAMEVPGILRFIARDGSLVTYVPDRDASESEIRRSLVGAVMGVVLQQRGLLVLHAAVVEIEGRAVAFAGPSGAGKSTMTDAFDRAGYPCFSDDLALIDVDAAGGPHVQPSIGVVRLRSDSVEAAGWAEATANPRDGDVKAARDVEPPTAQAPLHSLYALAVAHETTIESLNAADALRLLTSSTRANGLLERDPAWAANHLRLCGRVMNQARLRRLLRPLDYERLPSVVDAVVRDVLAP